MLDWESARAATIDRLINQVSNIKLIAKCFDNQLIV